MSFKWYDVDGVDRPLRLSDEHAKQIGATLHVPEEGPLGDLPESAYADDAVDVPPADTAPKTGSKAALVAEAERLGLPTAGTKADLEARIAEAP